MSLDGVMQFSFCLAGLGPCCFRNDSREIISSQREPFLLRFTAAGRSWTCKYFSAGDKWRTDCVTTFPFLPNHAAEVQCCSGSEAALSKNIWTWCQQEEIAFWKESRGKTPPGIIHLVTWCKAFVRFVGKEQIQLQVSKGHTQLTDGKRKRIFFLFGEVTEQLQISTANVSIRTQSERSGQSCSFDYNARPLQSSGSVKTLTVNPKCLDTKRYLLLRHAPGMQMLVQMLVEAASKHHRSDLLKSEGGPCQRILSRASSVCLLSACFGLEPCKVRRLMHSWSFAGSGLLEYSLRCSISFT